MLTARSTSEPISIHALREEGDFHFYKNNFTKEVFLSTPSARRATFWYKSFDDMAKNFYPRPPRGGRRPVLRPLRAFQYISIHALREEGDTTTDNIQGKNVTISIHALREEGDKGFADELLDDAISIHALREEGDAPCPAPPECWMQFLSTPSARRATCCGCTRSTASRFLSTPSARRATAGVVVVVDGGPEFLSTPSARRATFYHILPPEDRQISIHALREEGDSSTNRLKSTAI